MVTRYDRTTNVRNNTFREWSYYWWNWIMKYKDVEKYTINGLNYITDNGYKLCWEDLAANQNVSLDIIIENLDKFLYESTWSWILKNPHITWKFIEDYMTIIPDNEWWQISLYSFITPEFIKNNPQYPWDYEVINANWGSDQRNIDETIPSKFTFAYIDSANPEYINWDEVSVDTFNNDKLEFIIKEYRRHLAAYKIQQHWFRIKYDPKHPVCQRRLEREYKETFS